MKKMTYLLAALLALGVLQSQAEAKESPPPAAGGTGGSGAAGGTYQQDDANVYVPSQSVMEEAKPSTVKRLDVGLVGGIEGYTGSLAPNISPGVAWGVNIDAQPTKVLGLEFSYVGAENYVSDPVAPNAQILRNGGNVALKFSFMQNPIEPYVLGGVGFSYANVRRAPADSGYQDDTFGQIPLAAGINVKLARNVSAGARFSYDFLFDRDFTPPTRTNAFGIDNKENGDIWRGTLQVGALF
jgi:opacity protein-like surface antigen